MKLSRSIVLVFMALLVFPMVAVAAPEGLACTNYISVIAESGLVIDEYNADELRAPASMIKMVLLLLVTEGLEDGLWTLEDEILISKDVELIGGTQVYLKNGQTWPLESLMKAIAIASANDAAAAVAEGLWGTREKYLKAANQRVRELGMLDTQVNSPHGLPPDEGQESDITTARDIAILARACIDKPDIMAWVGLDEIKFQPGVEAKSNTNKLMELMPECDGLKTGYTRAAGFCLAATAVRDGIRIITVVMGCPKLSDRFTSARTLLEDGFSQTRRIRLLAKGDPIEPELRVRNSKIPGILPLAADDIWVIARESDFEQMEYVANYPGTLRAPMNAGEEIGTLQVELGGQPIAEIPVLLPENLEVPGWRWKLTHGVVERLRENGLEFGG
jgi:D-alanyl-D-alanine carboxypeptidase (penicillin-binding protein 5/6)